MLFEMNLMHYPVFSAIIVFQLPQEKKNGTTNTRLQLVKVIVYNKPDRPYIQSIEILNFEKRHCIICNRLPNV